MEPRIAAIERKTKETDIKLSLNLDGSGSTNIQTGISFFDHMLEGFARHGLFDLELKCDGENLDYTSTIRSKIVESCWDRQ